MDRVEFGSGIYAPALRKTVQHGQRDVMSHAQLRDDAVTLAVFWHHADTGIDRIGRGLDLEALAVQINLRLTDARVGAEDRLHQFGPPCADQSGNAKNLPLAQ